MLRRIKARIESDIRQTHFRLPQEFDGLCNSQIDEVMERRKPRKSLHFLRKCRCTKPYQTRHFFHRPGMSQVFAQALLQLRKDLRKVPAEVLGFAEVPNQADQQLVKQVVYPGTIADLLLQNFVFNTLKDLRTCTKA